MIRQATGSINIPSLSLRIVHLYPKALPVLSEQIYLHYGLGFKKRSYRTEQLHDINICKWHEIRFEVHSAAQELIKHVTC